MDSNTTSFSIQLQSNSSYSVPEEKHFNVDSAINVTQTSVSLTFNLIKPTSPLEPYSTVKTTFLSEHFQDVDHRNDSITLPSFARSAQFSKIEKTSSSLHSHSIKVESKNILNKFYLALFTFYINFIFHTFQVFCKKRICFVF